MITMSFPAVPVSDRVAGLIGMAMPPEVMDAEDRAVDAAIVASHCRPLLTSNEQRNREYALADLAWQNKLLAAYNPGLIVTPKAGAR